jgi:hypothetical protein
MTDPGGSTVTASTDPTASAPTAGNGQARGVVVAFPRMRPSEPADGGAFTVDCAVCAHRDTDVCDDCVVSFIVGREPEDALVVDADEARAVRLLERAGLVPGVRHQARASGE